MWVVSHPKKIHEKVEGNSAEKERLKNNCLTKRVIIIDWLALLQLTPCHIREKTAHSKSNRNIYLDHFSSLL
jgi:hypothetical protein